MRLPNPICWLRTLLDTLRLGTWMDGNIVSGHDFTQETCVTNCTVTVLRCGRCGRYEVLWEKTARSQELESGLRQVIVAAREGE